MNASIDGDGEGGTLEKSEQSTWKKRKQSSFLCVLWREGSYVEEEVRLVSD